MNIWEHFDIQKFKHNVLLTPADGEMTNASQYPKEFYARHVQAGVAQYEGFSYLIEDATLRKMAKGYIGKPVYVYHQKVDLENLKQEADGYITDSFYNEKDGWFWVKFLAVDDKAHRAISKGWKVSSAWNPVDVRGPGKKNNLSYERKIAAAEYTHLAIVPNPRYEDTCIFSPDEFKVYQSERQKQLDEMRHSKTQRRDQAMLKFKLFKNDKDENDMIVQLEGGQKITVAEMVNALETSEKEKETLAKTVKLAGKEISVGELVKKYTEMKNSTDAQEGDDEEADGADGDEGQEEGKGEEGSDKAEGEDDADDAEEAGDDEAEGEDQPKEEMKNSKGKPKPKDGKDAKKPKKDHFTEMLHANRTTNMAPVIETSMDMVKRGKDRYGSIN